MEDSAGGGGGIITSGGALTITNSTIANNGARGGSGGGIYKTSQGTVSLSHTTFSDNEALQGLTIYSEPTGSPVVLKNSIVAKYPWEGYAGNADCNGPITLLGNNVSSDGSCGLSSDDLRLGALQDNGGFTPTRSLGSGSIAIDRAGPGGCTDIAGQAVTTDQRGVPRHQGGGCDSGAFEVGSGPPRISVSPSLPIPEDAGQVSIDVVFVDSDAHGPVAQMSGIVRSDNPEVLPDVNLSFQSSYGSPQSRRVLIRPVADVSGRAGITITATDPDNQVATAAFTVDVVAINDQPRFTPLGPVTVLEDSGAFSQSSWASNISAGASNESGQALTFTVVTSSPFLFSTQPSISNTGTLTFTPAANASGSTTALATLKDNGGSASGGIDTTPQQSFTITITPVNDRPSFVAGPDVTVAKDSGAYSQQWASSVSAGPTNEFSQVVTFEVSSDSAALFTAPPAVSSTGVLNFMPKANATGTATVSVVLKDHGGTANQGFDASAAVTFTIAIGVAAPTPQWCAPAPNPSVRTEQVGAGRLRVTVTAQTNAGLATNALSALAFGTMANARVEIPGQAAAQRENTPLTLPAATREQAFFVQRVAPGPFRVDLGIVDGCFDAAHPFRTFVGGGTGVQ